MTRKFKSGFRTNVDYAYHLSELGVQQAEHTAYAIVRYVRKIPPPGAFWENVNLQGSRLLTQIC